MPAIAVANVADARSFERVSGSRWPTSQFGLTISKHEHDREDLIGQATALVWRVELTVPGFSDPWVVGFRVLGAASVFIGQDPVYHFNASGQLRRAFEQGRLIKAEAGQLISMTRWRTADEVQLRRETWGPEDGRACLHRVEHYLDLLGNSLRGSAIGVIAQVPPDTDILGRVSEWLQSLPRPLTIASAPHVGSERRFES